MIKQTKEEYLKERPLAEDKVIGILCEKELKELLEHLGDQNMIQFIAEKEMRLLYVIYILIFFIIVLIMMKENVIKDRQKRNI